MQISLSIPPISNEKEMIFHKGSGWLAKSFELDEFLAYVNDGKAWCLSLLDKGLRNQKHFISSQIIAIDLDSEGNTIEDILSLPFFADYGFAILPSPSWKPEHQKFRIIYILDEPSTDLATHKELILKVKAQHSPLNPDNAPSNPVTFFFGTAKNLEQVRTPKKILPRSVVDGLEIETKKVKPDLGIFRDLSGKPKAHNFGSDNGKERLINWIVKKLSEGTADGMKHETMGAIFYMVGGYISGGALDNSDVDTILNRSGWLSLDWAKPSEVMRQVNNFVENGKAEPLTERWFDNPPKEVYGLDCTYLVEGDNAIGRIIQLNEYCQVNGIGCDYNPDTKKQTFDLVRSQLVDWFEYGVFPSTPYKEREYTQQEERATGDAELYGLDSEGIAKYFMDNYGDDFLYLDSVLHYWNGKYWDEAEARRVRDKFIRYSLKAVAQIWEDAADFADDGVKLNINANVIKSVAYILNTDGMIKQIKFRDWRRNPYTVNVENGIFDFMTGKLGPHDKSAQWTSIIDVEYVPDIDTTEWEQTVNKITLPTNAPLADMNLYLNQQNILQMAFGIGLFNKQNEHLFHLYGDWGSGKGTLLSAVLCAIGDEMAQPIQETTLIKPQQGQAFELYGLRNCVIAFCDDVEAGKLNKSNVLKGLTGGGRLSTAKKGHEGFSYDVRFDLWVTSEDLIFSQSSDGGFYRRYRPFHIPNGEEAREGASDSRFKDKWVNILKSDKAGQMRRSQVLKWLFDGATKYIKNHWGTLPLTELQKAKIAELKADNDTVGDWLETAIENNDLLFNADYVTPQNDLFTAYETHCNFKSLKAISKTMFYRELEKSELLKEYNVTRLDKPKKIGKKAHRCFVGLKIMGSLID